MYDSKEALIPPRSISREDHMPETKKIYCNTCQYITNHELLSSHDRYHVEDSGWYENWEYRLDFGSLITE